LNGGLAAWTTGGHPVETGAARAAIPAGGWTPTPRPEAVAMADWIASRLNTRQMALVDARPDDEFTGADGGMGGAHPAGHLPGARQLVWTDLVSPSGQFLADAELRSRMQRAGAGTGVPVVTYCMVGMRASVVYFVARHLGLDVKMYDGSVVDWGRRLLPVTAGR
jgi:thiosulfate/3-mercaptopyruvate sulfurtransferase